MIDRSHGDNHGDNSVQPPSAVTEALDRVTRCLKNLIGAIEAGELARLDDRARKDYLRRLDSLGDQISEVDRQLILSAERAGLAAQLGHQSMTDLWAHLLGLSRVEASLRVAAAHGFGIRRSMLGE